MACNIGKPKAAVLPLPVFACPIMSRPANRGPIASCWIGKGFSNPASSTPLNIWGRSSNSLKLFIFSCFHSKIVYRESEASPCFTSPHIRINSAEFAVNYLSFLVVFKGLSWNPGLVEFLRLFWGALDLWRRPQGKVALVTRNATNTDAERMTTDVRAC